MGSVLKLVYDNWTDYNFPLPNGRHPIVNQYIKQDIKENNPDSWHQSQENVKTIIDGNLFFLDHSNFWVYFKQTYSKQDFVKVNDIKDDDNIYLYPLEIRTTIDSIYSTHSLTVNNETIRYSLIDTISIELRQLMEQGKVKILISLVHDPLDDDYHLRKIEQYFNQYGINGENIIFVPGNDLNIEKQKYFPDVKIKIIPSVLMITQQFASNMNSYPMQTSLGYTSDIVREHDLDNSIRNKRFLCFNRSMRPHRVMMAYLALKMNLLDNNIFSFLNRNGIDENNIEQIIKQFSDETNIKQYANTIYNMIPYELDTQHLTQNERQGFSIANNRKDLYTDTYVHLTVETRFEHGLTPFISEKTWRPIINLQPFIMIGNVYSLKFLQDLGFKTFSPFIDESYDNETDYRIRFSKIEKEIEKLNNLPIEELHDWYYSIKDILLYNQEHLKTFGTINPFDIVFDEIKRQCK